MSQAKFRDILNVYSFSTTLPGSGEEVEFKPLTTGQLKRILVYENEKNPIIQEQAIDELLLQSIVTEGFDIRNMFLEDRFFLIIQIRKKSKGEIIEFQHTCPLENCKSQTLVRLNLDDLPIIQKNQDENPLVELGNGVNVTLKHITRRDHMSLDPRRFKRLNDTQMAAEMQLYTHALGIDSIETEQYGVESDLSIDDKKFLIENVPTSGYEKIKDWYEDNFFGVDFNYNVSCIKCRHMEEIQIPLESAFFL